MSGGSYDYLFCKELVQHIETVKAMAERVGELAPQSRAHQDSMRVLGLMGLVVGWQRRLQHVWHDVEWTDSCDYSEDQALAAIAEYERAVVLHTGAHDGSSQTV